MGSRLELFQYVSFVVAVFHSTKASRLFRVLFSRNEKWKFLECRRTHSRSNFAVRQADNSERFIFLYLSNTHVEMILNLVNNCVDAHFPRVSTLFCYTYLAVLLNFNLCYYFHMDLSFDAIS